MSAPNRKTGQTNGNGSQDLVYRAILAGHELVGEIMHATGLEQTTVRTSITRLRDSGSVRRERTGGKRSITKYVAVRNICELADQWK